MKIIFFLLLTINLLASSAQELYNEALQNEEINGDFKKAKELYQKVIANYVQEQEFVARSMYKIAFIAELYGDNTTAENYYNAIISKYSNYGGLKILAAKGIYRITQGKSYGNAFDMSKIKTEEKKEEQKTETKTDVVKKEEQKDPFANDKYRFGKIGDYHILFMGENKIIPFKDIKGSGASNLDILDIKPTTSQIEITGKKTGYCEIMVKTADQENLIDSFVIDSANLNVKDFYLIKGEKKKLFIKDMVGIILDNDNINVKAANGELIVEALKEGDVIITVEIKNNSGNYKVNIPLKVLKSYDKTMFVNLKLLETQIVKFDNISSTTVTNQGIVDIKQNGNEIKLTATSVGETTVIFYGSDGAQLKYSIKIKDK